MSNICGLFAGATTALGTCAFSALRPLLSRTGGTAKAAQERSKKKKHDIKSQNATRRVIVAPAHTYGSVAGAPSGAPPAAARRSRGVMGRYPPLGVGSPRKISLVTNGCGDQI